MLRIVWNDSSAFFMSMDGRYSARSQEGGAVMSMDGRYSARSQEGGAVMSMDGRYADNRLERFQCILHSAGRLP